MAQQVQQDVPLGAREPLQGGWRVLLEEVKTWLYQETNDESFIEDILEKLCGKLRDAGLPIARAALYFNTRNPEWLGARILWRRYAPVDIQTFDYDINRQPEYLRSPMRELDEGASEVRQRLKGTRPLAYPLYDELRAEGITDYVAWPLRHSLGKNHAATFAADGADGFSDDHLGILEGLLPVFSLVTEIRLKNHITRTMLQTYVGAQATKQILSGVTTRGSGSTIEAAILICDMRGFTEHSETLDRDEMIGLLNDFFDATAEPVEKHGGEILKFVGDGFLAIFPTSDPAACENLLAAVRDAELSVAALNDVRRAIDARPIEYGMGVHVGDVLYGNIGSRRRLDFTVVGPAVNVASRLEALTKRTDRRALFSKRFVTKSASLTSFRSAGRFELRGLGDAVEVFELREEPIAPVAISWAASEDPDIDVRSDSVLHGIGS